MFCCEQVRVADVRSVVGSCAGNVKRVNQESGDRTQLYRGQPRHRPQARRHFALRKLSGLPTDIPERPSRHGFLRVRPAVAASKAAYLSHHAIVIVIIVIVVID